MDRTIINFALSGEEEQRFKDILGYMTSKPKTKPPNKTDVVKALMGIDPHELLEGWEREYLAGRLKELPKEGDVAPGRDFSETAPIPDRDMKVRLYKTKANAVRKKP